MKLFKYLLNSALIICISFSCKERQIEVGIHDPLIGSCKAISFTEFSRRYSLVYDSNGLLTQVFWIPGGTQLVLYHTFEYNDGKLVTINKVDLEGDSYPETKFEYGSSGVTLIRKFDGVRRDYSNPTRIIKEIERIEFGYNDTGKPGLLTRWILSEEGDFVKSHTSQFEYDQAGNLVIEKTHTFASKTAAEADYLYEYFYDDQNNSWRQLNYLFFLATESAPNVFSENNKIRTKLSYETRIIKDQEFKVQYDSGGNVTNDGYRYSGMTWNCK